MTKPRLTFVTDRVPLLRAPTGFTHRYNSFLHTAATDFEVRAIVAPKPALVEQMMDYSFTDLRHFHDVRGW